MALRLMLLVALVASGAVVVYGLAMDRTGQAIAFTVAGLVVLGVTSAITSIVLALSAIGHGRDGRALRALLAAAAGGLFAIAAAGSLAGAVVLAVLVFTI